MKTKSKLKLMKTWSVWVCIGLFLASMPAAAIEDTSPPYLVSPVPEPGAIGVPQCITIKVGIGDDLSGVDEGSITMTVNGAPPEVEPIIEPFYSENGYNLYYILHEMEPGTLVTIEIRAVDLSPNQNVMVDSWQFMLAEMRFDNRVVPVLPDDHAWLDYDREYNKVRFSWTQGFFSEGYRLKLTLPGNSTGTIDFKEGQFDVDLVGVISVEFRIFNRSDWGVLSSVGEIGWQVAPIDTYGNQMNDYTPSRIVRYASGYMPMPLTPEHGALLNQMTPPYFTWETLGDALEYYIVLIRKDEFGQFTSEIIINYVPAFCKEMEVLPGHWETYGNGTWTWTVIAMMPTGHYSDYFLYEFEKLEE
ncbi:hypothetical protein JXA40_07730 [bacterium]|nr:hypothetical protein [candidate division CSSED10-310 bacterium]